jgi:tryptophan-rich sensory protein
LLLFWRQKVAAWGGPLKLQREEAPLPMVRPTRVFTRPWHVLQWMRDPDEWINMMSRPKSFSNYRHNRRLTEPFLPNRHLFPATWSSIRIIQSLAIARAMFAAAKATTSEDDNRVLRQVVMRQFLVQQCLSDEWHRVLLVERRVALAGCIHLFYFAATIFLVIILATMDGLATFLMLPSTLAVVVSGWINLYIFWNRMEDRRRDNNWAPTIIDTWADRKQATVKAIQL